jgi:hypothetical protein
MDAWMTIEAISGAAAVALAVAVAFALIAIPVHWLLGAERPSARFAGVLMPEPAQRVRDAVAALGRLRMLVAAGVLVLLAAFGGALLVPGARPAFEPVWLRILLALLAAASLAGALALLVRLSLARRRLCYVRDAGIAVGQALLKLTGNQNRVFHEVPCGDWVLDHLVVGLQGVYAVFVVTRRLRRHNRLRLEGDQLLFAPGKYRLSLAPCIERTGVLAKQLGKTLDAALRIRVVIAVPGWEIESQAGDACLVVNERNLVMLRGWKDSADYLMHEDVERLQALVTERCLRPRKEAGRAPVRWRAAAGAARA